MTVAKTEEMLILTNSKLNGMNILAMSSNQQLQSALEHICTEVNIQITFQNTLIQCLNYLNKSQFAQQIHALILDLDSLTLSLTSQMPTEDQKNISDVEKYNEFLEFKRECQINLYQKSLIIDCIPIILLCDNTNIFFLQKYNFTPLDDQLSIENPESTYLITKPISIKSLNSIFKEIMRKDQGNIEKSPELPIVEKILFVDDDVISRNIIRENLRCEGLEIIQIDSETQLFSRISQENMNYYKAIIFDTSFIYKEKIVNSRPIENPIQEFIAKLVRSVKNKGINREILIICICATEQVSKFCAEQGIMDIRKPIDVNELKVMILKTRTNN